MRLEDGWRGFGRPVPGLLELRGQAEIREWPEAAVVERLAQVARQGAVAPPAPALLGRSPLPRRGS